MRAATRFVSAWSSASSPPVRSGSAKSWGRAESWATGEWADRQITQFMGAHCGSSNSRLGDWGGGLCAAAGNSFLAVLGVAKLANPFVQAQNNAGRAAAWRKDGVWSVARSLVPGMSLVDYRNAFNRGDEAAASQLGIAIALEVLLLGVPFAKGAAATGSVAPETVPRATAGSRRIFRAVEPEELADLVWSGRYRNVPGIGDGKYFFPTRQQADAFAQMMAKRSMGGPYCTTSGCIPSNLLRKVERITPVGEGPAYYVHDSMLRYIDDIIIHGG